jgi:hypothetical protein
MNGTTTISDIPLNTERQAQPLGSGKFGLLGKRRLRRFVGIGATLLVLALVAGGLPRLSQRTSNNGPATGGAERIRRLPALVRLRTD